MHITNPRLRTFPKVIVVSVLAFVVACNSDHKSPKVLSTTLTREYTIPMGGAEVSISLPDEYFPINGRNLCKYNRFYCSDTGWPESDSIFISKKDARKHIIIRMLDYGKNTDSSMLDTLSSFSALNSFIKEFNLVTYRDSPSTPLTEEYVDPYGNPYTYVMLFNRYNDSDTLYHRPNIMVYPNGTDSIECDMCFSTLHNKKLFCIEYYSLESFESFSFTEKRAVMESICVHDRQ